MRILLAQNSLYYPAHGGGDKSNRLLIEALAARGHQCCVVARISVFGDAGHTQYLESLAARGVTPQSSGGGVVVFERGGVVAPRGGRRSGAPGGAARWIARGPAGGVLGTGGRPVRGWPARRRGAS